MSTNWVILRYRQHPVIWIAVTLERETLKILIGNEDVM